MTCIAPNSDSIKASLHTHSNMTSVTSSVRKRTPRGRDWASNPPSCRVCLISSLIWIISNFAMNVAGQTCSPGTYFNSPSPQSYALSNCYGSLGQGTGPASCSYPTPQATLGSVIINASINGNAVPSGIQTWTVGTTGSYFMVAAGAAGASYGTNTGGNGIVVSNTYSFTAGQTVAIAVGQTTYGCSSTGFAAGGGGTFISIFAGTGAFSSI